MVRLAASSLLMVSRADLTAAGFAMGIAIGVIVTVVPAGVFTEIMRFIPFMRK